jgi:hypothetical protein
VITWQAVNIHTVFLELMLIIHLINKFLVLVESTDPCEHGNNSVGSGTSSEFPEQLNDCQLLKNYAPCS